MSELKPCPFCGGKADWTYLDVKNRGSCVVKCQNCGPLIRYPNPTDAREHWNMRNAGEGLKAVVEGIREAWYMPLE